jgi:predicted metal-dependent hydrolase
MSGHADKDEFKDRVRAWAEKLDVRVNVITMRPMRNKWASCSTEGNLTFNSELLGFDEDVRNYVIVHELLHFFVPNHGRLWKSLLRAYIGDYEALDLRLKQHYEASAT